MKKHILYKYILIGVILPAMLHSSRLTAQAADSIPARKIIKLHYFNLNNTIQYLLVESSLKRGKALTPQSHKKYALYLDSPGPDHLLTNPETNEQGRAKAFLPPALKTAWDALPRHSFILKEGDEELISDFSITKAKIRLDTSNTDGARNIVVSVMKLEMNQWVPAKDVEMKIGVERHGGILSAGDAATYTTDSSGIVTVEYKKEKLPGDSAGNIILVAKTEENEFLGNLQTEKQVRWGVISRTDNSFFNQRSLWSTRFKTPYWLLFMAYSIVIGVWGTLIYLVLQLVKIKKSGVSEQPAN